MRNPLPTLRLGSLKFRLMLASVALILVSVALTVHFTLREVRRGTERIVLESREDDARRLAAIVSRRLIGLQRALRAAATTMPRAALDEAPLAIEYLEANAVLRTMFSAVFVVALDGRVVAFSDGDGTRGTAMSFADRSYFKDTMAAQRPLISNALMSRVSGEPIIVFTLPITGAAGEMVGILGGSLRLTSRSLLDDLTQASEDRDFPASTIVTDATGQIIAHPSNDWLLRSADSEPSLKAAMAEWKGRGRPIEPAGYSMRSGGYDVGLAGVPDADWLVFRTAPADALLVGIAKGEERARWVGLGFALLGGVLTLVITVVLLAPLGRLQSRALALLDDDAQADGDWPRMGGELGELSRVLQHRRLQGGQRRRQPCGRGPPAEGRREDPRSKDACRRRRRPPRRRRVRGPARQPPARSGSPRTSASGSRPTRCGGKAIHSGRREHRRGRDRCCVRGPGRGRRRRRRGLLRGQARRQRRGARARRRRAEPRQVTTRAGARRPGRFGTPAVCRHTGVLSIVVSGLECRSFLADEHPHSWCRPCR